MEKDDYIKIVKQNISTQGFHVTSVLEENDFTPFSYSIGIYENFKIPEVIVSGLGPNLSNEIIINYCQKFREDEILTHHKYDHLIDRFPVIFCEVKLQSIQNHALGCFKYYNKRTFKFLQIVIPDLNGKFPHENGYDYDQEILGEF